MVINFTIWSPFISLLAIAFLYPLRLHYRGHQVSQFYAAIFAFPALVSSIYLFKIACSNGLIKSNSIHLSNVPIILTINFSFHTSLFLLIISLSISTIIFLSPKANFTENISISSVSFFIIFIMSAIPDQLVRVSILSIGTMIMSFMLLHEYNARTTKLVLRDFLLQRISDFLALSALIFMLATNKNPRENPISLYGNPNIFMILLLNVSILIRYSSLFLFRLRSSKHNYLFNANLVLRKVVIGVGSQILLVQFAAINQSNGPLHVFLLIAAATLLSLAIISLFFYRNLAKFFDDGANVLLTSAFVLSIEGLYFLATTLIAVVILLYPIVIMHCTIENNATLNKKSNHLLSPLIFGLLSGKRIFFRFLLNAFYISAKFLTNLINHFYSGFLFYYLPQISITIMQIPLRLFHNGNIQRSLIFAAIMLVGYVYWWGK